MASEPRGIRNNNPGNIEYGPFARSLGATGSDGRFAIFPDIAAGYTAMDRLIADYQGRGLNTVGQIVGRWAPTSEPGNTSAYAATVAQRLGVGLDDALTPDHITRLPEVMAAFENGRPVPRAGVPSAGPPSGAPTAQPEAASALAEAPSQPQDVQSIVAEMLRERQGQNTAQAYANAAATDDEPLRLPQMQLPALRVPSLAPRRAVTTEQLRAGLANRRLGA